MTGGSGVTNDGGNLLSGIRVLDLTRVMSGPFCTSMLADLGAEIIKVERPGFGELSRHVAPYRNGQSTYFALLNRGKRSITVDLKHEDGVKLVKSLVGKCDVLVENFRPGVMHRLGLDYETLAGENDRLVYASITGFGPTGEFSQWPAFDLVIQAMSGMMSMTGERDGRGMAVGESIADVCTGMFASWGIVAALFDRERTGKGRRLEVAMLDSIFSMLLTGLSRELFTDEKALRAGNRHPETYPVDSFPTKGGDIVLVCLGDRAFRALAEAMGKPELAEDPRLASNRGRNEHEEELRATIAAWTGARSKEEVLSILREGGVPCAPVWSMGELLKSGYPQARGLLARGFNSDMGHVPLVPQPVHFSGAPRPTGQICPTLGEDTDYVLKQLLELDDSAAEALRRKGVV